MKKGPEPLVIVLESYSTQDGGFFLFVLVLIDFAFGEALVQDLQRRGCRIGT